MTWSWFPTTNCTIHFWKWRVFISWDNPRQQGFFHYDCYQPWQRASSSHEKANHFTPVKKLQECAKPTFCSQCCCFYSLSSQLWILEEDTSASPVRIKARERSGMWSSINPTRTRNASAAERGCGSHSRSWKFTQLKHLTLLRSFTLYIQINLHHDFALLAQKPTLINQWSPATSWSCMNFDDQLQVTAGEKSIR